MNTKSNGQTGAQNGKRPLLYTPRVVVKFYDHVQLPYDESINETIKEYLQEVWEQLAEIVPDLQFTPLFTAMKPQRMQELVQRAVEYDARYRPPNLFTYYQVYTSPGGRADELAKLLHSLEIVELAYVAGGPTPPPVIPGDDPLWPNQGYLDAAPDGIDAEYAWTVPGGNGAGIQFVDLEQGWTLNHEDLVGAGITLISGVNKAYFGHGTAVLGEIAAVDNTLGVVGISPNLSSVRVVSQWRTAATYDTENAILDAIEALNFGDVLLLEAQTTIPGSSYLPVEVDAAVFEMIRLGTALGIIIVEAGGNGATDLDTATDAFGNQVFNRSSADFRDSGAIVVGAASSAAPHTRMSFSNYGSRIDCYGWGQSVETTGDGWMGNATNTYTSGFSGTSSASPIVAGAALAVQGMAENSLGYRFSAWQMRAILSDSATGTLSNNPATDRIGVMPNLRNIADDVLNLTPDVYLRDYVGDTGDPHAGSISASPDVILRKSAVANPQATFGAGSGTENNNTLGFEAEAGQDNFIYVRVRNRGGSAAANVTATVYWAPVASLLTPDLWTLVGSVAIPSVPTGNVLTVSNAITWPAAAIPATGHYCFVGIIGNAEDPAPAPADFLDWDKYRLFIRNNNNVTWRNFNVVDELPSPGPGVPPGFFDLPFLAPGAPDRARPFGLEVVARLPEEARLLLEMPLFLADALQVRSPFVEIDREREVARMVLNPHGRNALGEVLFPAKARARMRLFVHLPKRAYEHAYQVYVRQLYRREEVGRVTWHIGPREKPCND